MKKSKYIKRKCRKHGNTKFVLEGSGYYRCVKCRASNISKHRNRLKVTLVEYKGGECQICGYDKYVGALDFHHIDPKTKSFGLSVRGLTRSLEKLKKEADKCILLCANCHREVEYGITKLSVVV